MADGVSAARDGADHRWGTARFSQRLHAARRFFFGEDVFISYSRADAAAYALGLANALTRQGISCFLDQWGTPPGRELPERLLTALRTSTMFVLVGTPGAARSAAVQQEVETFIRTGRPIIPVTLGSALEQADWFDRIRGLSLARESEEALAAGQPSDTVLTRIVSAEGFTRRNKRLRTVFWSTAAIIVLLLGGGGVLVALQTQRVAAATALANEKTSQAADAVMRAETAQEEAIAAGERQAAAVRARDESIQEAARAAADAETQRRGAQALTLVNRSTEALDASPAGLERSLLLAIESLGRTWTAEGVTALERGLTLQLRAPITTLGAGSDERRNVVIAATPDGRWLAVASGAMDRRTGAGQPRWRGRVAVLRTEDDTEIFAADVDERVHAMAISPDGRWLAAGGDQRGELWDVHTATLVTGLWSAPDALTADDRPTVAFPVVLPAQRNILRIRNESRQGVVSFSPDGRWLAVVTGDALVRLYEFEGDGWHAAAPLARDAAGSPPRAILTAAFSPNGRWLAAGVNEAGIWLWDLTTRAHHEEIVEGGGVFVLAFTQNGPETWLASAAPASAHLWRVQATPPGRAPDLGEVMADIPLVRSPEQMAFTRSRRNLAIRDRDAVRLLAINWNALGEPVTELNRIGDAAFMAMTDTRLMVASARGISVWEDYPNTWEARWILHQSPLRGLAFSPDGRWLASATAEGVRVFDGQALTPVALAGSAGAALAAHFTPDGRWLVAEDTTALRVWRGGSWHQVTRVPMAAGGRAITSYVTSDGRWFVSNRESHLWLLDIATGRGFSLPLADSQRGRRFALDPTRVRVSPDAAWAIAHGTFVDPAPTRRASDNLPSEARWRAWRLASQEEVAVSSTDAPALAALLQASTETVATADAAAYRQPTANARWRATSDGSVLRLWPLQQQDILQSACARLTRNLSLGEWRAFLGDESYRPTCRGLPQQHSTGVYRVDARAARPSGGVTARGRS